MHTRANYSLIHPSDTAMTYATWRYIGQTHSKQICFFRKISLKKKYTHTQKCVFLVRQGVFCKALEAWQISCDIRAMREKFVTRIRRRFLSFIAAAWKRIEIPRHQSRVKLIVLAYWSGSTRYPRCSFAERDPRERYSEFSPSCVKGSGEIHIVSVRAFVVRSTIVARACRGLR